MLASFLESEWKHRCHQILTLIPWFDAMDFFKLFGQQWEAGLHWST
jgi:TAG lipase/steryl ester hydrolase/phospholipase A2/LPA acyltransferase